MVIFQNRQAAGALLAKKLQGVQADLVLALPRGGVVVAAQIARRLRLPLDVIITRKIGAPTQEELALGAVDSDGSVVWNQELIEDLGSKIDDLETIINLEVEEIKRREQTYRSGKPVLDVEGKKVILVDDGIATGATALSAVNYLKRHGVGEIILTVPVAAGSTLRRLTNQVDSMVVLQRVENFGALGSFYQDFLPVSDDEVIKLLESSYETNSRTGKSR